MDETDGRAPGHSCPSLDKKRLSRLSEHSSSYLTVQAWNSGDILNGSFLAPSIPTSSLAIKPLALSKPIISFGSDSSHSVSQVNA